MCLVMLLSVCVSQAQNTKGDKPTPASRENRFKSPFKKGNSKKRVSSTKRVRPKERSVASRAGSSSSRRRASGVDRPGKPIRPIAATQPNNKQKGWRGDIAGYRLRTKSKSSAGSGRKNIYPQYGRYVHNPSKKPKPTQHVVSNRGTLAQLKQLESRERPGPGKKRVVPRSVSRSYTARKSINVYANFARPKRRGEQASTKDLAGRPLRKRNFESRRPGVSSPLFKPYEGRGPMGDKPGKIQGGYRSATRDGRAWSGDIAGRKIRGRNFTSKNAIEGRVTRPSRNRSATRAHPGSSPLPPKVPGIGADGIGKFQGRTKGRRPLKGGGSVSGRLWNNNGRAIEGKIPAQGAVAARFQGNIKAGRPTKGGGSVSGKVWNNNNQPLVVRTPAQGARAALFQGNIRAKRPEKGMNNVSGSLPHQRLAPGAQKINGYPGKWKRFEVQPGFGDMGESFTGYIKLNKFRKNYVQHPDAADASIKKKRLKKSAFDAEGLSVKMKRPDYVQNEHASSASIKKRKLKSSAFDAEGLSVKVKRPTYVQNEHASAESIKKRKVKSSAFEAEGLIVRIKRPDYVRNKNSADEALWKTKPSRSDAQAGELQVRIKQKEYGRKPHAAEGSMAGIKPSKSSVKANEYARSVKRNWDYIRNPSSADEALKTREPGKAFARVSAYQGNIKMQKYTFFEKNRAQHPDTKFIKPNKNNVDEERDALTNFKLWWARLFKNQETQPENLKYKGRKPRYDKGEQGLWYE